MPQLPLFRVGLQKKDPSPYWTPETARQNSLQDFMAANNESLNQDFSQEVLPRFDYGARAAKLGSKTALTNFESALNSAQNAYQNNAPIDTPGTSMGNPRLRAILRALGAQESGNNYGAVNSDSGALGRWQVMPSNIQGPGGWDMEALGRNISTDEFLKNKKLQNAIVRYKFKNYLQDHGLKGALSAWYSGDPNKWNNQDSQGNYPSIHNYVMEVLKRLGIS